MFNGNRPILFINATINNYNSSKTSAKDVIVVIFLAVLLAFAFVTMADARRSSRQRRANSRYFNDGMEVDLEAVSQANAAHPRPSQTSPGFLQPSPATRNRQNNRRRLLEHRQRATMAGGRRVGSARGRGRGSRPSTNVARSLYNVMTAVAAFNISDAVAQELTAMEHFQAIMDFMDEHGHPDQYTPDLWQRAEQQFDPEQLQLDLELLEREREAQQRQRPRQLRQRQQQQGNATDPHLVPLHDCGSREKICEHCGALLWKQEDSGLCCSKGQALNLATHFSQPAPQPLRSLMEGTHPHSRLFKTEIRRFNNALAMASSGLQATLFEMRGPSYLSTTGTGRVHHFVGPVIPGAGQPPNFAQLYIIDNQQQQLEARIGATAYRDWSLEEQAVLAQLQALLHAHNHYVQEFRQLIELARRDVAQYDVIFKADGSVDKRRYNAPTGNDVAGFMPGGETDAPGGHREFKMRMRGGGITMINDSHPAADPLHFVLFHPQGELGFISNTPNAVNPRKKLTIMDSVKFFMHDRTTRLDRGPDLPPKEFPVDNSLFIRGARLYQEWLVDQYCKVENSRLNYLRNNQKQLRAEVYQGLLDGLGRNETTGMLQGRRIVLPASFIGGPRHMAQSYQDAMALVRAFGKPDLFITMTCNPKWEEIQRELKPGETANDRPDLVARVFKMKLDALMKDLKKGLLGRVQAHVHVIEFQKRGLPHAHILLILGPEDKPLTPTEVDAIVRAELPDPAKEPVLYELVTKFMLHGPCGVANPQQACMKDEVCTKNFPKAFQAETVVGNDGYPKYKRSDSGITTKKDPNQEGGFEFDNRWVVPYNPTLLYKYQCHINVEVCTSVKAVKYLFKYVYKGHDRAEIRLQRRDARGGADLAGDAPGAPQEAIRNEEARDEIREWQDGRYISAPEAAWRLYGFSMHSISPNVVRLPVHLPNGHQVYFRDDTDLRAAAEAARDTKLTQWFKFNAALKEELGDNGVHPCLDTTYQDAPKILVWTGKQWKHRERRLDTAVGRMYHVMPSEGERYYLRMLLHHVPGATSFEDLKTVDGVVKETFKAACQARGLLADDSEWRRCLETAAQAAMPVQLRGLFASLLLFNEVAEPQALWEQFKDDLSEDIKRSLGMDEFHQLVYNRTLLAIDSLLQEGGKTLADFGLPLPPAQPPTAVIENELLQYNAEAQARSRDEDLPKLNDGQRAAYNRIMAAVERGPLGYGEHIFFIDGIGGAGKTFLYRLLLNSVRAERKIALAVASSGIAALLLEQGRTAHSRFKIPVQGLCDTSTCYVSRNSPQAALIKEAALILWDEAPMMHRYVFEATDRTFRDIMATYDFSLRDKPFGGKVVVLGGDFRQILPVVRRGRRADVVGASVNKSQRIWPHVAVLRLHENMRVSRLLQANDPRAEKLQAYAAYLLRIGDGTEPTYPYKGEDFIRIPPEMVCPGDSVEDLINEIYGALETISDAKSRADFIIHRAILTPRNEDVDIINKKIINEMDLTNSEQTAPIRKTYFSADSVLQNEQQGIYPLDFLNKLEMSGVPPHEIPLQEGCPIILLRNMTSGLANGTRLIVKKLLPDLIDAEVFTGPSTGQRVFIPRLNITPSDAESWPFTLCRRQFPVRPAFAMTINKSQGQTFNSVGVYLPKPVFVHGQLYVSKSRVGDPDEVRVMVPGAVKDADGAIYTANVVYKEVLLR